MTNRKKIFIGLLALLLLTSMIGAGVYATTQWHKETVGAGGHITVNCPPPCTPIDPVYAFQPQSSYIDYSGVVACGGQYSLTQTLCVENTGTDGLDAACNVISATISGIYAEAKGLPAGWVMFQSNPTGFPLAPGETGCFDLTLVGPAGMGSDIDLDFTIDLFAS